MNYHKLLEKLYQSGGKTDRKAAEAIETLLKERDELFEKNMEIAEENGLLEQFREDRLRFIKALRFYAGGSHYDSCPVEDGLTARKALEPVRQETLVHLKP